MVEIQVGATTDAPSDRSSHAAESAVTRDATPSISVVLPTYNRADIVMEAISSVVAQTFPTWELLVVDDHSTDSTAIRLEQVADPRVRVLLNRGTKGNAGARNYGFTQARGEWICQIDSDDLWDSRMLEYLAAGVARAGPRVGVVYGSDHSSDMETGAIRRRRVAALSGYAFPAILERQFYHHCAAAIRRVAFDSVGGYDESLDGVEDTDLQHRLTLDWEVLAVPEAIYHYRLGRPDQLTQEHGRRAAKQLLFLAKHDDQLRVMPRSLVKMVGAVMVTCLKGGRWGDAARLWGRMLGSGLAAPRLAWTYNLRAAVVVRDMLRRRLSKRPARRVSTPMSSAKRSAEPG